MKQRQYVSAILVGSWMVACGGSGGDTPDGPAPSEVEGVWAAPCGGPGDGGPPGTQSVKRTITLSGDHYTYQHLFYSDTTCSTVALTLTEGGTFTLGGAAANPPGAKDINFVQSSTTAKPENGEAVMLVGACTRGGSAVTFTDGTATDIAGAMCGDGGNGDTQTSNGSTILGIYVLDTNTLQLGNGGGNEALGTVSPGTRPSSVNDLVYSRLGGGTNTPDGGGGGNTPDAAASSEVEGVWAGACGVQSGNGPPGTQSGTRTITLSGNHYTYQHLFYSDTGCSSRVLTLTESGTFTLGGAAANPIGAKDINFVQSSITAKPENGEAAALVGVCTRGGSPVTFADGTTTNIAGAMCNGDGSGDTQTSNGSTILGIYVLATNTLQLGNGGGSEDLGTVSPGTRPSSLNNTVYARPGSGTNSPDAGSGIGTPDGSSGTDTPDASSGTDTPDASSGTGTPDAAAPVVVEGVWAGPCGGQDGGGPPGTHSGKRTLTLADGNYSYRHLYYSDTGCSSIVLTLIEVGTFTLGGAAANPVGAKDINFVQSSITAKPENGEAATLVGVCTRGGSPVTFADGTTTDIAGAMCNGGGSGEAQTSNGSTIVGIYVLATNTLQLGNEGGSEELGTVSPGTRPSSLNNTVYIRQ